MKKYEAMFLLDPALANDWPAAEAEVRRLLDRTGARVLALKNWDERRLAYPIRHHKRGLYVLTFFEAAPEKIGGLERDVQLSEKCLRVLVLRRENLTQEAIDKAIAAGPPPKSVSRGDEWSARPRPAVRAEPETTVAVEEAPDIVELEDTKESPGGDA